MSIWENAFAVHEKYTSSLHDWKRAPAKTKPKLSLPSSLYEREVMVRSSPITPLQWGLVSLNIVVRTYCSLFMIISDCDETFNYWEPLNLLLRGFGKQTWEYSPEYAIRSYAYLLPYYVLAYPLQVVSNFTSINQFYWLRLVALCGFTAYTEYRLFRSIQRNLHSNKISNWFLFFTTISPGMSHASVALLPSSFAMNWVTWATSNVLDSMQPSSSPCTSISAISQFLIGGIFGWPFALALAAPFGLYTVFKNLISSPSHLLQVISGSLMSLSVFIISITSIDSWYYQKLVLVPLNIVLYNVFGGEGEGPEIFGVEDFSYYVLNLLLNFNVVFILGYLGLLLNPLIATKRLNVFIAASSPLLLWSVIFGSQPHKEERFLYPIYPLICFNAAILTNSLFTLVSNILTKISRGRTFKFLSRTIQVIFAATVGIVSILRIFNLVENYSAPIAVAESLFNALPPVETSQATSSINVCVGREWYHFPNSFFLPDGYRLRFIKSGFDGLLPGDFLEEGNSSAFGIFSRAGSTSSIPFDMNNKNQFSESKVIPFEECAYYFDNTLPIDIEKGEKSIIGLDGNEQVTVRDDSWEVVNCSKLISMDGSSRGIGKILWIPHALRRFVSYDVEYMQYCALKNVNHA